MKLVYPKRTRPSPDPYRTDQKWATFYFSLEELILFINYLKLISVDKNVLVGWEFAQLNMISNNITKTHVVIYEDWSLPYVEQFVKTFDET